MIGSGRGGEKGKRGTVVMAGRRRVAGLVSRWSGGRNWGQEGPAFQGLAQAVQDRQPVLLDGVEMYPRMRQKSAAASALRNVPEIFCWTLTMRMSRSA